MASNQRKIKASVSFREGKIPLYRLKAPINLLGLPLSSGFSLGEQEELALNVGSDFKIGPTVKVAYRPNDENVPNRLVIKAGIGPWLTPKDSFLSASIETDLKPDGDTRIWIRARPTVGDFTIRREGNPGKSLMGKKLGKLAVANGASITNQESDALADTDGRVSNLRWGGNALWGPKLNDGFYTLKVNSKLPFGNLALASVRWGASIPRDMFSSASSIPDLFKRGLPSLILDKITFEPIKAKKTLKPLPLGRTLGPKEISRLTDDVIMLHAENSNLRRSIEDLRSEFSKSAKRGLLKSVIPPPPVKDNIPSLPPTKDALPVVNPKKLTELKTIPVKGK